QSNDVAVLPGVGRGFFNDQAPAVFAVGTRPLEIVPLPSPGDAGRFLTVNAGSNDLSVFSFTRNQFELLSTVPSGGGDPVAAVAGDLLGGGTDLVVANHEDGQVSFFRGVGDGFNLIGFAHLQGVTDVEVAQGDHPRFYGAVAGSDAVIP